MDQMSLSFSEEEMYAIDFDPVRRGCGGIEFKGIS